MALGVKLWQNSGRTVVEAALRPPCGRFIRPGLIILKLGTNDLSRLDRGSFINELVTILQDKHNVNRAVYACQTLPSLSSSQIRLRWLYIVFYKALDITYA